MIDKISSEQFKREYGILCRRFLPSHFGPTPFGGSRCQVAPLESTVPHSHPDGELFYLLRGQGRISIDGNSQLIGAEDVVYLPAGSQHVLTNLSANEPLEFISLWWDPPQELNAPQPLLPRRSLVVAAPPTPNGDLHLGHLSGPYLAADVYHRHLSQLGHVSHFHTGTDDHQSYVPTKADRLAISPLEVLSRFSAAIQTSLAGMQIRPTSFRSPFHDSAYQEGVRQFVAALQERGTIHWQKVTTVHCPESGKEIFEAFVSGSCPHCSTPTNGHGCENCGLFNQGFDLGNPVCNHCQAPAHFNQREKLVLPLEPFREPLSQYFRTVQRNARLAAFTDRVMQKPLPVVALSFESDWGLAIEGSTQRLYEWVEMAAGYWHLGQTLRESADWDPFHSPSAQMSLFFGFDNSFFYTTLLPAVWLARESTAQLPVAWVTNEFYRLEGKKFSTSRNHAIWGSDFLRQYPADAVRLYLALDRPEVSQTSFSLSDFIHFYQGEFTQKFEQPLLEMARAIANEPVQQAPVAVSSEEVLLNRVMEDGISALHRAFSLPSFSLREAARTTLLLKDRLLDSHHANTQFGGLVTAMRSALAKYAVAIAPLCPALAANLTAILPKDR